MRFLRRCYTLQNSDFREELNISGTQNEVRVIRGSVRYRNRRAKIREVQENTSIIKHHNTAAAEKKVSVTFCVLIVIQSYDNVLCTQQHRKDRRAPKNSRVFVARYKI